MYLLAIYIFCSIVGAQKTAIAQTSMIAACLTILIYIAVITTGNYLSSQDSPHENPLSKQ
jgi:hypothetical protein